MVTPGELAVNRRFREREWPHRATLQRRPVIGQTPYGEPEYGDPVVHLDDLPCRFWVEVGGGEQTADNQRIVRYAYRLALPAETDVTEQDVVSAAVNQRGENLIAEPLNITTVIPHSQGILLLLEEVR